MNSARICGEETRVYAFPLSPLYSRIFYFFFSLLQLVKLSMEDLHGREPESVPDTSDYYELPIKRGFSSIFRKKSLPTNTLLIL